MVVHAVDSVVVVVHAVDSVVVAVPVAVEVVPLPEESLNFLKDLAPRLLSNQGCPLQYSRHRIS